MRKGFRPDFEAYSAFSGRLVNLPREEMESLLGNKHQERSDLKQETTDEGIEGEDVRDYLVHEGIDKILVVGLATDYWSVQLFNRLKQSRHVLSSWVDSSRQIFWSLIQTVSSRRLFPLLKFPDSRSTCTNLPCAGYNLMGVPKPFEQVETTK